MIKIINNQVCDVSVEICDMGHEHESTIPLEHGPETFTSYMRGLTIRRVYAPVISDQLKAANMFERGEGS